MPPREISMAISSPSDVAMTGSHDTCKSAETKNLRGREETLTSSSTFHDESAGLTLSTMQENRQMQSIRGRESTRTFEWTDEKHSMYLKSIEASFVNQLYDSKHLVASCDPATTSGQFKVHRGGCWKRINFDKENPQMNRMNELHDLNSSPWIQHYRSSSKQPSLQESVTSTCKVVDLGQRKRSSSESSEQLRFREPHDVCNYDDTLGSDTEMSDQNFVDEEVESKEENNRSNLKRVK